MEMYTKITSVFCSEQYCFGLFRVITIDWDSLHAFETEGILINTTYLNSGPMKEHKAPKPCTATEKKILFSHCFTCKTSIRQCQYVNFVKKTIKSNYVLRF